MLVRGGAYGNAPAACISPLPLAFVMLTVTLSAYPPSARRRLMTERSEQNYRITSDPFLNHSYIDPLPERAENGFPAAPTPHGHAKLRPRSPFSGKKNIGNRTYRPAEWREFPRYALVRILMHAVNRPARFWRVFRWFVACFTGFRQKTR